MSGFRIIVIWVTTALLFAALAMEAQAQYRRVEPRTKPAQVLEIEGARHIAPRDLDPAVQDHLQAHTVLMPDEPRGELLLWLAGSGALVDYYTEFMKTGRDLGFHVVGLSYANDPSLIQLCGRERDTDCFRLARREKITGQDLSPRTSVPPAESIEHRLRTLLAHLDRTFPTEGWGRFLNGAEIDWNTVTVAGHSQGGGNAAMLGQIHRVARVVMFSSPSDSNWRNAELADWTGERFQTPAERFYGLTHRRERNHEQHLAHWQAIGLDAFGAPVSVDEQEPPFDSHILVTDIAPLEGNYHVAPIGDPELARRRDGVPQLRDTWAWLLTGASQAPSYVADEVTPAPAPGPAPAARRSRAPTPAAARTAANDGVDAERLFDRLDRNRDGYLSLSEIPAQADRLRASFDRLDRDGDGRLAPDEIQPGRRGGGAPLPSAGGRPAPGRGAGGANGGTFIDPEVLGAYGLLTYQDSRERIWVQELAYRTGPVDASAQRWLMDSGAAKLIETWNGPEFGVSADGWRLYYTKPGRRTLEIWEARLDDGVPTSRPLVSDGDRRQSILVSRNTKADSIRLAFLKGDRSGGDWYWLDVADPSREHRVVTLKGNDSPRWIDDTFTLVFAESRGRDAGQLRLYDTVSGRMRTITDDAGVKSFAYGWLAPDFGGDMLVLAMVDDRRIGIWRDPGDGGMWPRIATIDPPAESQYPFMGSPEPFVFNGRSFLSLVIKQQSQGKMFRDSEVWVFGLHRDGRVTTTRVDSDDRGEWMRSDPETVVLDDRVLVFYNGYTRSEGYQIYTSEFRPRN